MEKPFLIIEIERLINHKALPKSPDVEGFGYATNEQDDIIGINLSNCELKNIDNIIDILIKIPTLESVSFSNNQIIDIKPVDKLTGIKKLKLRRCKEIK